MASRPSTEPAPPIVACVRELLRAQITAYEIERDRWEGRYTNRPVYHPAGYHRVDATVPRQGTTPPPPPTVITKLFSEVVEVYCHEHKRRERYDVQVRSSLAKFITIIGGDKPIGDITKADCRYYKETLLKSVGATTTNTRLNGLNHLWTWAQGQGFIPEERRSPITGLTINARVEKKGKLERKAFTDDQLSLILTHPKFLKHKNSRVERYWLVLALVLSGARREEIAQLAISDLKEEGGIPYFNITDEGESQSLKNDASKRRVPIHSDLIALGFMDYVATIKKRKAARLFPQLKHSDHGYPSAVGLWFVKFIRSIGLIDPALVLHSTRHTATTRLHAVGVPENLVEMLLGHQSKSVHGKVYVHREDIPIKLLSVALEKLQLPAVKALVGK